MLVTDETKVQGPLDDHGPVEFSLLGFFDLPQLGGVLELFALVGLIGLFALFLHHLLTSLNSKRDSNHRFNRTEVN